MTRAACIALTLLLSLSVDYGASVMTTEAANRKQPFSGLMQPTRPDFDALYGIWDLQFVSRTNLVAANGWTDETTLPTTAWYDAVAAAYTNPHKYLLLDIESYYRDDLTQAARLAAAAKYVTIYTEMKTRMPDYQIGFYGLPTVRDLFRSILAHDHANYIAWQAENNDFAAMWAVVDFVAPSIYYPYTQSVDGPQNPVSVHTYFHENIAEAIRCRTAYAGGRPVPIYPYVSPYKPATFFFSDLFIWDDMVRTAYLEADGFILWHGLGAGVAWNEFEPWWINFKSWYPFGDRTVIKPRATRIVP